VVNEPTESNEDGDFETNSENTESEKTKKYTVGGISATIYRDDAEDLQVHAEQALYDQKARKATMDGSVSIRSGEMTVETESVTWLNEENLLKSNSPVRIRNRNTDLTAESLQLFPKNDHMILKNCVGIIKLKD
jgi:LPS export ABC transporter protein LptC